MNDDLKSFLAPGFCRIEESACMAQWEAEQEDEQQDDDLIAEDVLETASISFWQMIRGFFFQTSDERKTDLRRRMQQLTAAIEIDPDAASSYLQRGEVREQLGHYELAQDDFLKALELAEEQFEGARWGIGSQVVMDTAWQRLQEVSRRIN